MTSRQTARLAGALVVGISQSGQSPDIVGSDVEVTPLLDVLSETVTLDRLASVWSSRIPSRDAFAVAH